MTKRLPLFITLVLASFLAAPQTWAATGNSNCRPPAIIVDVDQTSSQQERDIKEGQFNKESKNEKKGKGPSFS